jgi:hypothetical protein
VAACRRIAGVPVGWSNEIVAHVAEVKNVDPVVTLDSLPGAHTASCTLRDVWRRVLDRLDGGDSWWHAVIDGILDRGTLATRILAATGPLSARQRL